MKKFALAALVCALPLVASAETTVADPWVRATVPQQKASGAFMRLTSDVDARLLAAASPVADAVEIHEMTMQDHVMKMHPIGALDLPAGKAVELKPGGYHVMLLGLKAQLKEGDSVPLTLTIENRDGSRQTLEVKAPVRPLGAAGGMPMRHGH